MPVIIGAAAYPEDIISEMQAKGIRVDSIDALELANQAGSSKACNIVLMGRLARYFDIPEETWISAIEKCVKPRFIDVNKKAFALGYHHT